MHAPAPPAGPPAASATVVRDRPLCPTAATHSRAHPHPACRASGISSIYHSQGECDVATSFLLSSPCQLDEGVALAAPEPQWTEGLTATGTGFTCSGGELH